MKNIFVFISLFCLCACSQFEPFEDMRREAGQIEFVGKSSNDTPAICYNPIWHNEQQVLLLAEQACARTKRKPVFQETKILSCRFVNPSTAIYKCE